MTDFGKWVGGVMAAGEGARDPIARSQMVSQIVAGGRKAFGSDACDLLVVAVPPGTGSGFMEKWVATVGENPALQAQVDL